MSIPWGGGQLIRWLFALAAMTAVLFPREARAYRTIADRPDFPDSERVRWSERLYQFEVFERVPDWLPIGTLATTADRAFQAWATPSCAKLQVAYAGLSASPAAPGDGKNTIEVIVTGWEVLGYPVDAVGATDLQFREGDDGVWEIIEADIRINGEHHQWSLSDQPSDGRRSLLGTLRHEGGHALGLLHPCEEVEREGAPQCGEASDRSTIMYPLYEPAQVELVADDAAGICYLYPSCEVDGCPEGSTCTDQGCLLDCGSELCTSDEVCLEERCVSRSDCEQTNCSPATPAWVLGCGANSQCPDGLCLEDGSCAQLCSADSDCAESRPCIFDENPDLPGYCGLVPPRKLGESCSSSNECEDDECLVGAQHDAVCTRTCSAAEPCPSGWSCSRVENRSVCVPPRAPRGCGVSPMPGAAASGCAFILICALALARRSSRPFGSFRRPPEDLQ